jgi:hypothetical protein
MKRAILLCAFLFATLTLASPAAAKSYSADRFDSIIHVRPDGTLDVTETVVFRFEDGTFRDVFREIPLRRTDGIEVMRAEMQGERLPFGKEAGTVEVKNRSNKVRVVWRFTPIEGVTREFVLNYVVRGAIRQDDAADVLVWRATPGEHRYRIASSTIEFALPVAPSAAPTVTSRKAAAPRVTATGNLVRIQSDAVNTNGWIDTSVRFARGAIVTTAPAWQRHAADVAARSTSWVIAGSVTFAAGLMLLVAWRQSYDTPPGQSESERAEWDQSSPPDRLPAAIGGVVAANGRTALEQVMATLFSLGDRGEIDIDEKPRGVLGQRDFVLTRRAESRSLAGYEQTALDVIFKDQPHHGATASLSQARSRLARHMRKFSAAMNRELTSTGLLDAARKSIRDRYVAAAIVLMIVAALATIPAALLVQAHGPWPLLIPGAIVLVALTSTIFAASISPLSNDGVRRGAQWRQYRKHLRAVAQGKRPPTGVEPTAALPYAIALGLAGAWSKFMKAQNLAAPSWFHPLPSSHDSGAFAAFIATGGAGATTGHGGAGAGAAGGGASGAH